MLGADKPAASYSGDRMRYIVVREILLQRVPVCSSQPHESSQYRYTSTPPLT